MYQAGIKKITLYENKEVSYTFFDPLDSNRITALTSTGEVLEIENMLQPEFEEALKISPSGEMLHDYNLKFFLFELSRENIQILEMLKTSFRGWCILIEFYDGNVFFYDVPLFCDQSSIKPQREMVFTVEMNTRVPAKKSYYDLISGVSLPIYRADTTLLTADSAIYTADYAL